MLKPLKGIDVSEQIINSIKCLRLICPEEEEVYKLLLSLFDNSRERYSDCSEPESLPGVKKKSFVLPYGGGEIWFEHLDGMYQFTDLVLAKL